MVNLSQILGAGDSVKCVGRPAGNIGSWVLSKRFIHRIHWMNLHEPNCGIKRSHWPLEPENCCYTCLWCCYVISFYSSFMSILRNKMGMGHLTATVGDSRLFFWFLAIPTCPRSPGELPGTSQLKCFPWTSMKSIQEQATRWWCTVVL